MSADQLEEMGPIDYIVLEWSGDQPVTGEVMPLLLDLVDRGHHPDPRPRVRGQGPGRVGRGGSTSAISPRARASPSSRARRPGLLGQDDLEEAANALEPGTVAAVLMWENRWAAPVAVALRRSGGQLVASGRIPIQAIIASLDASESVTG